jgi:anthranilate 1,2-dioxygenase ferredoxin reductase component
MEERKHQRFVIIGGGVAGHRAALELARSAPTASIDLVSEEPHLPYDRPPLSKELLNGRKAAEDIVLSGAAAYAQNNIRWHSGTRVTAIDRARQKIVTDTSSELAFDRLLLATGSRPRRLPSNCVGNATVHYLRTLKDALLLRDQLVAGRRIAIIGGGFIGLEVAATAIRRGCHVTVLEADTRVLARGMPAPVSAWVDRLHRSQGVDIKLSALVRAMHQDGPAVDIFGSDWTVQADVVIAGIGAQPNVELAADAGLKLCDGIMVDAQCRTSDPAIFAAGEVTNHPVMYGMPRRIESWKSSAEQGAIAARSMTGAMVSFDETPTLWSDQFDTNIQAIGFPDLGVGYEILGDPASNSWTVVCLDEGGSIVGGVAINRGRDASALRRAVRDRANLTFMQARSA